MDGKSHHHEPIETTLRMLGRDDILNADDRPVTVLPVPEWGGAVRLRGLTGEDRDAWELWIGANKVGATEMNLRNARVKIVASCIVGEDGNPLFGETDIKRLAKKSARALTRVYDEACKMSGLTKEDVEKIEASLKEEAGDDSSSGSA